MKNAGARAVGTRTFGLSSASKIALFSVVAICLLINPFMVLASYGSSSTSIDSTRFSPDVHHRTLTSPNAQFVGLFGWSVAVSGNVVVVGAPYENASGYYYSGHAYIFNSKTGALISNLTSPNVQTYGEFGFSVATSGKIVVVGAPYENASGYEDAGHAYIL